VAYADCRLARAPEPLAVIDHSLEAGCHGLLIDTFNKQAGDLFAHCSMKSLERIRERARQAGLLIVLAGGLHGDAIAQARGLEPDYVAVRGAACRENREGAIDPERLRLLVSEFRNAPHVVRTRGWNDRGVVVKQKTCDYLQGGQQFS
jgi:hypothetical protein